MTNSKKVALAVFLAGILIFLSILFAPFLLANILQPIALSVWLFLRLFVLSIGQQYYWGFLIFLAIFIILRRISQQAGQAEPDRPVDLNATHQRVEIWRSSLKFSASAREDRVNFKRDLTHMLVSTYTSKQQGTAYFEVYEPLKQGQIPLPDSIYAFLFPREPLTPRAFPLNQIWSIQQALRNWVRRWTGQDTREYYQAIDEFLRYLETSLETGKNDDSNSTNND